MTPAEFEAALRSGRAVAFDTNSVWGEATWATVCGQLRAWARLHKVKVALVMPAIAHQEKVHDLRYEFGTRFRSQAIDQGLQSAGVDVVDFDRHDADATAAWLATLFVNDDAWRQAKRLMFLQRLGLPADHAAPGQNCSATVDWLIAGQATARGWLLVTNDQGAEFVRAPNKLTLAELVRLVASLR